MTHGGNREQAPSTSGPLLPSLAFLTCQVVSGKIRGRPVRSLCSSPETRHLKLLLGTEILHLPAWGWRLAKSPTQLLGNPGQRSRAPGQGEQEGRGENLASFPESLEPGPVLQILALALSLLT